MTQVMKDLKMAILVSTMIGCFTLNCGSVEYNYLCIYDCSIWWNASPIFSDGTGKTEYLFHGNIADQSTVGFISCME